MWLKTKSLSFKLIAFYVVSVLLITATAITFVEYQNYKAEENAAARDIEVGLGYLNGATPNNSDMQIISYKLNSPYDVTDADISNGMKRFTPLIDFRRYSGGVSWGGPATPLTYDYEEYETLKYNFIPESGEPYQVVLTIQQKYFPLTIQAYNQDLDGKRSNKLCYLPIPGNDNIVFLVSANAYTFDVPNWTLKLGEDFPNVLLLTLVFSVIFGLLIFWITIRPLRRITRATELLSNSDLSQRVDSKSGDEIGRLAHSFNTMADRLEESFSSQKHFISDAAHEIRTPLASMKTSVTKALSSPPENKEEYQKLTEFLNGRINTMESLVNDLLFLSRVDEGRFKPDEDTVSVSEILNEAGDAFRYLFEEKGIAFTIAIEPDLNIKGDRKLFLRVISNLLDNAGKNTPSGGSISLKALKEDRKANISVADTGIGIPEEHLPHIFERFYKVPGAPAAQNGFGLGLAISKSIVASFGGEITVQSEPGRGTIFTIVFPVYINNIVTQV